MALSTAHPGPSGETTLVEAGKDLAGLVIRTTAGVPRAGMLPASTASVVSARADMKVDVAAFHAALVRSGRVGFINNDGTVVVDANAAPVSNSRIDVLWVKQNNSDSPDSDSDNLPEFGWEVGTPGAVPVKPTVSEAGALEIASITIPSTATATNSGGVVISQSGPFTALVGGKIWVRTSTDLAAITGFAADTRAWAIDTGIEYRFDGTDWEGWESAWISYTPTLSGFAVGTGGAAASGAWYKYTAGRVEVKFVFVFGSSGATFPTAPTVTLPSGVTLRAPYWANEVIGPCALLDSGASSNDAGRVSYNSTDVNKFRIVYQSAATTASSISPTAPWTWAAGDGLAGEFEFDPA